MPIISVRYNESNRQKGKVWYKMCCNAMKQYRRVIKTVKDANNYCQR